MNPESGVDGPAESPPQGLPAAIGDFTSSVTRVCRAFAGLFGFEAREGGWHVLQLALLAVAVLFAIAFAYLFLLLGVAFAVVGSLGGGWTGVLLALFIFHVLLAVGCLLVLRSCIQRPFFPGLRRILRQEFEQRS